MLSVKTGLLLLAFYGSLFHSCIYFSIFSSLSYFSSEADPLTQPGCSCHTCAQKKTVLKGGFSLGLYCEQHDPFSLNLPKDTELRGCCGTLLTRCIPEQFGVTSSVCCQVGGVIL